MSTPLFSVCSVSFRLFRSLCVFPRALIQCHCRAVLRSGVVLCEKMARRFPPFSQNARFSFPCLLFFVDGIGKTQQYLQANGIELSEWHSWGTQKAQRKKRKKHKPKQFFSLCFFCWFCAFCVPKILIQCIDLQAWINVLSPAFPALMLIPNRSNIHQQNLLIRIIALLN